MCPKPEQDSQRLEGEVPEQQVQQRPPYAPLDLRTLTIDEVAVFIYARQATRVLFFGENVRPVTQADLDMYADD